MQHMKKIRLPSIMCFFVLTFICGLLTLHIGHRSYAEEETYRKEDMCYYETSASFALTEEYVLISNAWGAEEYAWFPDTVGLDLMSIASGKTVRIAEFPSTWAQVFTNGECFYVVESNYLNEYYDGPFKISIGRIEPEKMKVDWQDTLIFGLSKSEWADLNTFDTKGSYRDDYINDIHLENGKLYLISYYKIYAYDLSIQELSVIHQSEEKILNKISEDRSVLYKGKLYIHKENGCIFEIDLTSYGACKVISSNANPLIGHHYSDAFTAPYNYYILNDILYYCNTGSHFPKTVARNLKTGEESCILESPITIFLINEKGIYFDIYDGGSSRYFLDFSDNSITPMGINDFDILEIMMEMVK